MEENFSRNDETKHPKCLIKSVEVLQFFHSRVGLGLSPHGDYVQAFQPKMDHHFGLPFKISEWGQKYMILLHSSLLAGNMDAQVETWCTIRRMMCKAKKLARSQLGHYFVVFGQNS